MNKEIENIIKKRVQDRTQQEHIQLLNHYGGVREYLLSMGAFKEDKEYYIYICKKCGFQMEQSHMGKRCPECDEWTYHKDCQKKCVIVEDSK